MLIDYDHLVVRPRAGLILILRYIKGSVIIIVPSVTKNRKFFRIYAPCTCHYN